MKLVNLVVLAMSALLGVAGADSPVLAPNDVTWLWPVPESAEELNDDIAIASLTDVDGAAVWSDAQFMDVLATAGSDAARVGSHRIGLPDVVRSKDVWRIVAFRADPTAPGTHELIRKSFGEKPQLRLVLQPVTVEGDSVQVHDIAVHLVYSFMRREEGDTSERPDREHFRRIVDDLDALKKCSEDAGVKTGEAPLGIHPGLKAHVPGLRAKVREFLSRHLQSSRLDAMAIMGLDDPEPWIFIAMAKVPPSAEHFAPVPFLPAQMLSFRSPSGVSPAPRVNNRNLVPSGVILPVDEKDRRGVSTAPLFEDGTIDLNAFAMIGKNEQSEPVFDTEVRNRDIPDLIADPARSHFFNTDCLSCHTETARRIRFSLEAGPFAYLDGDSPPRIDPGVLPKHKWNVRNLGWFPPSKFIGGGPAVPTVTQRTANETSEVVDFIEREYRDNESNGEANHGDPEEVAPDSAGAGVEYLDQGWTPSERLDFYFSKQGSQLLPYHWFLNLERADSDELLRSDRSMRAIGFIPHGKDGQRNPDGLPIGFVLDSSRTSPETKEGFLGPDYDRERYPVTDDWLGLTCAACHTSELNFKGHTYRVDGGAAMADVETLLSELAKALRATASDDDKFQRFERGIRESSQGDIDTTGLRDELRAYTPVIERLVARNKAAHPYGLGRLDAFGAILNQICEASLEIPENHRESNAPVSYPFLWDTPMLDWVQWNSSVEVPIARNVGEVLGVFAHAKLTGTRETGQFASSARLDYLHRLEEQLHLLRAPRWQQEFGEIDLTKAAAGRRLFAQNCATCHNMRDENGNFEMTAPNGLHHTFIRTTSVPFRKVGTDERMVVNFITRTAKPGALRDVLRLDAPETQTRLRAFQDAVEALGLPRPNLDEEAPAGMLLGAAVSGVIERDLAQRLQNRTEEERQDIRQALEGFREGGTPPFVGGGYKARPLVGIWATAPFGHAGSVPSLYQWLLPEDERVTEFFVGNREFDPIHLGYSTDPTEHAFRFRTTDDNGAIIPGNSNKGHSGPGQTEFTDEERWQIIEYLKTQ
jgi:hypothetical protein